MTVKSRIIVVLSSLLLVACSRSTMYTNYQTIPLEGWSMDSVLRFEVPVTDTVNAYDVLLHIRHTDAYPYQNMWLFANDGGKTDTIEFYLADDRGRWLGNGQAIKDMPVLYRENVVLKDSLYILTLEEGMRDIVLRGISEIGVEIVR
ncbi:MAG: gliding motility lipoprotein GldH [Paludibacteraceae bacterium]|nr:gliding motility lipoprotein GldH [Paludibacteraceae bacterium]